MVGFSPRSARGVPPIGGEGCDKKASSFPRSAWERREMLNTEKKLLRATNQKLTHARAKILFLKMKVCVPTLEHGNEEKGASYNKIL